MMANRRDLMDGPTHPTTHQNLAHQIHRGSFALARVSLQYTPTLQNDRIQYSDAAQSALHCTQYCTVFFSHIVLASFGASPHSLSAST